MRMPDSVRNINIKSFVRKIMALTANHRMVSVLLALAVAAAGFWFFRYSNFSQAQTDSAKWKNFKEEVYGLSVDYPANWSFDINYDRYAAGLMGVELNNKKCNLNSGQCNADCADIRVLIGKKPNGGQTPGLFTQLYEDFMMVRDFSSAALVNTLDLNSKKVFKVASDAPTLALTGGCAGPLYVFQTDSDYFVYVFAGYGNNAAGVTGDVEKIISSINIK